MTHGTPQPYDIQSPGEPSESLGLHLTGRASIAKLRTPATDAFLGQVEKIEAAGARISPTLRMAAGYAEGYRDAAGQAKES
ncbi:hypothetical protein [Demequina gelatinilytica]|uniref:hypothetical protein n=1 Tax=Demequina gelatinilytica TaxID=1638980 RepID=UPI000782D1A6|nr:hypothetical protein [Demequina gelatinilytica]